MKPNFQRMENTIRPAADPEKAARKTAEALALLFKIAARVDAKRASVHTMHQEPDSHSQTFHASVNTSTAPGKVTKVTEVTA